MAKSSRSVLRESMASTTAPPTLTIVRFISTIIISKDVVLATSLRYVRFFSDGQSSRDVGTEKNVLLGYYFWRASSMRLMTT